jgi:hypothetical protein
MEDVMHKIHTLICVGLAGFISFAGYTVYAQPPGSAATSSTESMMQQLMGGGSTGSAIDNIMNSMGLTTTTDMPTITLEAPLTIDAPPPEVNKGTIDVIDARTGLYPPRLKINFAEFPLRSFATEEHPVSERKAGTKASANIVAKRIQDRLRVPQIDLIVKDRMATVTGTVTTERQRKLVESMLRFEPGIDTVKNEITITP